MSNQTVMLVPDKGLSRLKWEYEYERTSYDDLLCFGTADMDYRSPQPLLASLHSVLEKGHLGYPMATEDFYEAIRKWLIRTADWDIDAKSSIGQNVGIYTSAWNVFDAITNVGDRVAILTPVHFCFKSMLSINNRIAVECPLAFNNGKYIIDYSVLESCLASGCKVLWLSNPHNPVGRAWNKEELLNVAELCMKYNVLIVSDDVYCGLMFPGHEYTPIASLSKEISYRTITMYSISKAYNTMGLKHSFIVAENPDLFKKYNESLASLNLNYGLNIMGMSATISAYNECDSWLQALRKQIYKNYLFISDYFKRNMPQLIVADSDSTYFAWIDMRALGLPHQQIGYLLEQEEHMIVVNGSDLGKGGAGFIRVNLATSEDNLRKGVERFKHFYEKHFINR